MHKGWLCATAINMPLQSSPPARDGLTLQAIRHVPQVYAFDGEMRKAPTALRGVHRGSFFLLADGRLCPLLPDVHRIPPTPGLQPVAAQIHQSCASACRRGGRTTSQTLPASPAHPTNCSRLPVSGTPSINCKTFHDFRW